MEMSNDITKYDDKDKGGYSYAEKLKMVAEEQMDPKEIGLASADDAKLQIMPDAAPKRQLGDFITFEASAVPLDLRAQWAYSEEKIIPPDKAAWIAEWKEKNKDSIVLQSRVRCGTALATAGRTVSDMVLGFCVMLEDAAALIRKEYEEENAGVIDVEATVIDS
jgi:hypothetical protein